MSRYLVTGCAGFIAAEVCAQLLAAGHEVDGLDCFSDAYDPRLKQFRLEKLQSLPRFRFRKVDVAQRAPLAAALREISGARQPFFSGVLHLAARAGVRASTLDPWSYYDTNVVGTLNMLEFCREQQVPKIVIASSSSVYGDSRDVPYREDQPAARPLSPYAASKQATETLAFSYHHLHRLDVSLLRYFTVYGPTGRPDMSVFRFVRSISSQKPLTLWGDGTQSRDFTYVADIARGTIAALRRVGYEIFNLGGDHPYQVNELLAAIARLTGRTPIIERQPAHPADVPQTWADISKARRLLEWSPETPLAAGLAACLAWYQEHQAFADSIA